MPGKGDRVTGWVWRAGLLATTRSAAMMAHVAASRTSTLSPTIAQDGAGQGAARVAPFEEAPQGVAGHAEGFRRLTDATPQNVGPQVFTNGVLKLGVERCALARRPRHWL